MGYRVKGLFGSVTGLFGIELQAHWVSGYRVIRYSVTGLLGIVTGLFGIDLQGYSASD